MPQGQLLFTSRKFRVERCTAPAADGRTHAHDIIMHPGAAVMLPLLDDGRIVLIRNRRVAADAELLELPAGTIDPPEPPLACARRELAEETGYEAESLRPLTTFYSSPGICTEMMHAFLATGLRAGPTRHEATEQIRVEPHAYDDALAAIRDGRIIDGKTIVTLLYYDCFVRTAGA